MHVLIAEDDAVSRRLLENFLVKWGYQVTPVANGSEAWDAFQSGSFTAVITDWMMPELDGPSLIRKIRSAQRGGYVYTMLLTSRTGKDDLVAGMEAGADDFLTKPFDKGELRVRLRAGERIIRLEHNLRATQSTLLQNEQLASLGRFAAGVAHEINNPLCFVKNNLVVLGRDVDSTLALLDTYAEADPLLAEQRPSLAESIQSQRDEMDLDYFRSNFPRLIQSSTDGLSRIQAIVQNLRAFARVDESDSRAVDLNAAIESTVQTLRHELNAKSLNVTTRLEPVPMVACHSGKINMVILNILTNAIQASSPGQTITLETRLASDESMAIIEFQDQGSGITPEHMPHILEPFYTTKPLGQGTGLGLSTSYGIIRDHGGSLEIESAPGAGSTFRVRLPVARAVGG